MYRDRVRLSSWSPRIQESNMKIACWRNPCITSRLIVHGYPHFTVPDCRHLLSAEMAVSSLRTDCVQGSGKGWFGLVYTAPFYLHLILDSMPQCLQCLAIHSQSWLRPHINSPALHDSMLHIMGYVPRTTAHFLLLFQLLLRLG